jgi:hypothetical protein
MVNECLTKSLFSNKLADKNQSIFRNRASKETELQFSRT